MRLDEHRLWQLVLYGFFALALVVTARLRSQAAPYGRHNQRGSWGPQVSSLLGWLIMEVPASVAPMVLFLIGGRRDSVLWTFFVLWQLHYFHRAFIYPLRRRGGVPTMPLLIALSGLVFNLLNTYLNWRYLTHFAPVDRYAGGWLSDPRFIAGTALFFCGLFINQHADWVLMNLRKPGETGYKIPYGGLYRFVSCPNYFGELLEWLGWAILTFSLPGLAFFVWTAANLIPRAMAHHRDYLGRFANYPKERRAVLPFVL